MIKVKYLKIERLNAIFIVTFDYELNSLQRCPRKLSFLKLIISQLNLQYDAYFSSSELPQLSIR